MWGVFPLSVVVADVSDEKQDGSVADRAGRERPPSALEVLRELLFDQR